MSETVPIADGDAVVTRTDTTLSDHAAPPHIVIEPGGRPIGDEIKDLLHYRDLLYFLVKREVTVRYKQTLLGAAWAVLQPFMTMVVFSIFLGRFAGVPSDNIPYPVFAYLGLLPWTYFSGSVNRCSASIVANQSLLGKVYFPRMLIPMSSTLAALVDFAIAASVLVGLMLWYGLIPAATAVVYLPLTALTAMLALGVGMWLASLNVQFRDVQHATPFLLQLWMFATPIVYPASLVPDAYRFVYELNPMAGIIAAYRAAALGNPIDWASLGVSAVVAVLFLITGWWQFRRMDRHFADIV